MCEHVTLGRETVYSGYSVSRGWKYRGEECFMRGTEDGCRSKSKGVQNACPLSPSSPSTVLIFLKERFERISDDAVTLPRQ